MIRGSSAIDAGKQRDYIKTSLTSQEDEWHPGHEGAGGIIGGNIHDQRRAG